MSRAAMMRVCAGFIQSPHTLATEALDILLVDETQNKKADSRQCDDRFHRQKREIDRLEIPF
jgi:hypothetical protein